MPVVVVGLSINWNRILHCKASSNLEVVPIRIRGRWAFNRGSVNSLKEISRISSNKTSNHILITQNKLRGLQKRICLVLQSSFSSIIKKPTKTKTKDKINIKNHSKSKVLVDMEWTKTRTNKTNHPSTKTNPPNNKTTILINKTSKSNIPHSPLY